MVKYNNIVRVPSHSVLKALVLMSCVAFSSHSFAGAAAQQDIVVVQPDGSAITAVQKGDEWTNWFENTAGYTIAQNDLNEWYFVLGFTVDGTPILSAVLADNSAPAGIKPSLRPNNVSAAYAPASVTADIGVNVPSSSNTSGPVTIPLLFILAEFDDQQGATTEASWADMLNNNVVDYFDEVSYGNASFVPASDTYGTANNGVVGWVNVGPTHLNTASNTGVNNRIISRNAMVAADPYINYASYDADGNGVLTSNELSIVVIVAGYERAFSSSYSPSVWGHAWCLFGAAVPPTLDGVGVGGCYLSGFAGLNYAQFGEFQGTHAATMGIIVHEIGHLSFALPDLYDYDSSSPGIGYYGVMGSGSWGRAVGDTHIGETPTHPSAFTKVRKEWVNAKPGTGIRSVKSAGSTGANSDNTVYRINTSNPNEYFLIENRNEAHGYDRGLNSASGSFNDICGIGIWHIDDSQTTNQFDTNRWVDFEEADNVQGYPAHTDFYSGGYETDFNDNSIPNSRLKSNAASGITINQLSACGTNMTVNFGAPRLCNGKVVTMMGTSGYDTLVGTAGADVIAGLTGNDTIKGLGGNDTICGDAGNDTLLGGDGVDWLYGDDGDDLIKGQLGNDVVIGGLGNDILRGSQGNDTVKGGYGADVIDGGWGDDRIFGDYGNDNILGNLGADIIYGGPDNDTIDAGEDPDLVYGGNGDDFIKGGPDNDILYGGSGVDTVRGSKGDDILYGENGSDTLVGGVGDDNMYGGYGTDTCTTDASDTDSPACEVVN